MKSAAGGLPNTSDQNADDVPSDSRDFAAATATAWSAELNGNHGDNTSAITQNSYIQPLKDIRKGL